MVAAARDAVLVSPIHGFADPMLSETPLEASTSPELSRRLEAPMPLIPEQGQEGPKSEGDPATGAVDEVPPSSRPHLHASLIHTVTS